MENTLQNILCVDDEQDILDIVQMCLSEIGNYNVTVIDSVVDAVYRLPSINPDLILMDMMMPSMNGMEAIRQVRAQEKFRDIPIVLMTARVQASEVQDYMTGGATAVIAKPFDPMTLAEQVQAIWDNIHGGG